MLQALHSPRVLPEFQNELVNLKSELNIYNARVERIPAAALPERQRPNRAGKMIDTFNLKEWWNAASSVLPSFFKVLRAIAGTHAPNLCPPERVWSILGDTFDAEQTRSRADYIELSLKRQYNNRTRE